MIGFCRLRLDKRALIRELHVYGRSTELEKKGSVQHRGFGKKLIRMAEGIARKKYKKIYVISGIGVKGYYKKLGYSKEGFYMSKEI